MGIKLSVGANPHIRSNISTNIIMIDFLISLLPIILVSIAVFQTDFLILLFFSVSVGILIDYLISLILEIEDKSSCLSSVITTLLLVLTLPINVPLWIVFFGITFSIVVGKLIFGGLGQNLFNPALLGRVFLMMSFPQYIFHYKNIDDVTGATMLQLLKYKGSSEFGETAFFIKKSLFGINQYNSIGECSLLALIIGFIYLCIRKRVNYRISLIMLVTILLGGYMTGSNGVYYMLSGGAIFGALYFLTDPVTSPYTNSGKIAFAVLVGVIVVIIREFTSHPEGVAYAILFGNMFTPLFNKLFEPRVFGRKKNMKEFWNLIKILGFSIIIIFILHLIDIKISNKVEAQKEKVLLQQMKELIPEGRRFDIFENSRYFGGYLFVPVYNEQNVKIAYIVKGKSKGYSEKEMEFLLGIDLYGKTMGHKIIDHKETLGLGSQIAEKEYKNLWVGKTVDTKFNKGLDSPSGATYTFLNFFKTMKDVLEVYNEKILKTSLIEKKTPNKVKNNENNNKIITIESQKEGEIKEADVVKELTDKVTVEEINKENIAESQNNVSDETEASQSLE